MKSILKIVSLLLFLQVAVGSPSIPKGNNKATKIQSSSEEDTSPEKLPEPPVLKSKAKPLENNKKGQSSNEDDRTVQPLIETKSDPCDKTLRVMTLNAWNGGQEVADGIKKIAKHILQRKVDIVTLQEIPSSKILSRIRQFLGRDWTSHYQTCLETGDIGILTKHVIYKKDTACYHHSLAAKIGVNLANRTVVNVSLWAVHLPRDCYGPYLACNKKVDVPQLEICEIPPLGHKKGRVKVLGDLTSTYEFLNDSSSGNLQILAGSFNSPSHLDWVAYTQNSHCGLSFEWPATRLLTDIGFKDAFRQIFPDPQAAPGDTWSPIHKFFNASSETYGRLIAEPQDRVDMIFYRGNPDQWIVRNSEVYWGRQRLQAIPDHYDNDWPSDHAAVLADFQYLCKQPSADDFWN